MTCLIFEDMCRKELLHEPKMTSSFNALSENEKEELSQEELECYYCDKNEEEQYLRQTRKRKGAHLTSCTNEQCQRIRIAWQGEESLKQFIVAKSSSDTEAEKN